VEDLMAWFTYTGKVVRSIRVSNTKSVAARPNQKIEIVIMTKEAQALVGSVLRPAAPPVNAVATVAADPEEKLDMRAVLQPSALAQHFAEKGVTTSKDMAPRKPVGAPEYTIHELAMSKVEAGVEGGAAALDVGDKSKVKGKRDRHSTR